VENFGIFCDHLKIITKIWCMYIICGNLVHFLALLYILSHFGMLFQEEYGYPVYHLSIHSIFCRVHCWPTCRHRRRRPAQGDDCTDALGREVVRLWGEVVVPAVGLRGFHVLGGGRGLVQATLKSLDLVPTKRSCRFTIRELHFWYGNLQVGKWKDLRFYQLTCLLFSFTQVPATKRFIHWIVSHYG
jgi:hypothetical protein